MDQVTLDFTHSKGNISRYLYGHFAEHIGGVFYDGLWVGQASPIANILGFRQSLAESFRKLNPPVLRWPGGCYAETYDWRDGIGPRHERPTRVNWWYSHDKRLESNQVGTHEFMDFCRITGAEPYIAANMTSVTPLHIRNWIEYCNFGIGTTLSDERARNGSPEPFNVRFWGIGNENWGGGGQMTAEDCAKAYLRYSTVCDSLDKGNIKFIMCGANGHDVAWTRRLLQEYASRKGNEVRAWGMSVHYYCGTAGSPTAFTRDEWYKQMRQAYYMRRVLDDHRAAMDEFDPERGIKLVVDEWGCWHKDGSGPSRGYNLYEQQSSMRDAVVAALTLNLFNDRCDFVEMANVAQLCNNLHSLYLAGGEHFVETPNYHVFSMFKTHQDARHIPVVVSTDVFEGEGQPLPLLSASASLKNGKITITIANLDMDAARMIRLAGIGGGVSGQAEVTVLAHDDPRAHNSFENPEMVMPITVSRILAEGDILEAPPASVVSIVLCPQQNG
ncbi:MAG: alpha-N-arabinofuranosidase [Oscillospiraceae bacterium]|jgi:alpha-N-arabinofuranosidase|nr:alpha-N-arabinofuranosidase [Oscillospiraceae bacterium]